jgi:hypothetical protein
LHRRACSTSHGEERPQRLVGLRRMTADVPAAIGAAFDASHTGPCARNAGTFREMGGANPTTAKARKEKTHFPFFADLPEFAFA